MSIPSIDIFGLVVVMLIGLAGSVFWIWTLIDCATMEADHGNTKVTWIVIIAVGHVLGASAYLFIRRPERRAELNR